MKKICLIILNLFALALLARSQNIGIGTASPNASAMLDISSTTKGIADTKNDNCATRMQLSLQLLVC
jgi:hypothetical protein